MSDNKSDPPIDLGIYAARPSSERLDRVDLIAISISLVWLVGSALFFLILGTGNRGEGGFDPMVFVMVVLAVFMPVAMVWVAATAAKSARIMRHEADRLQVSIEAMRQLAITQAQDKGTVIKPSVEKKLDEIARAQRKTESAIATFATTRAHAEAAAQDRPLAPAAENVSPLRDNQPSLALETDTARQHTPLSVADFITAVNFPETAQDKAGFEALSRALRDRRAAKLVQASQDVLTLISQDGIYMDDLDPDRARPEIWRRFAQGERGRTIAALGGIRDRSSLALATARMKQDGIFRDAVHHFLRTFDSVFAEFEKAATDAEIAALAETRTARAFMLLGRATGIFD